MYLLDRLKNRNLFVMLILDMSLILSSILLSIIFRYDFDIPANVNAIITIENACSLIIIKIFFYRFFSLYRGLWRYTSIWDMLNIIKANMISTFALALIIYLFFSFNNFSRSIIVIDFIICTGFISVSRLGIRMFFSNMHLLLKIKVEDDTKKNIIIIGAGDTGQTIAKQILQKTDGYYNKMNLLAIFDDNPKKIGQRLHSVPIIGPISLISKTKLNFDEIYICAPSANKNQIRLIVDECKKTNKPFKILPSISGLMQGKLSISQFREVSIIDLLGRKEVTLDESALNSFLNGKRVLVTGAGGSIGSELVRQCIKFKPSVLLMLDISELNLFEIDRETSSIKSNVLFKPVLSDIRNLASIENVFDEYKPQIVFHAAAYKHVPIQETFPWEAVKTNVFGTINLSSLSIKFDVEKFVLVSTDKAVKPTNVMGATKRLAEIIIQDSDRKKNNTDFMAVRFGNVLGSSGSVIPIFKEQIRNGGPVTITDPEMERYFMSIPEASQLILQAGGLGKGGEVFILDMGKTIKIIDLAQDLIRLSGFEPDVDIPVKITGTRPGEKKIEELSLPSENLVNTKHNKIFVLNNNLKKDTIDNIIINIINNKDDLLTENSTRVKSVLSSILEDYEPELKYNEEIKYLKEMEAEA